jgi:hypothetical protein
MPSLAYLYTDRQPLELAEDYPYTGEQGYTCLYNEELGKVSADGFTQVTHNSPFHLQSALLHGPVSVAIDASMNAF